MSELNNKMADFASFKIERREYHDTLVGPEFKGTDYWKEVWVSSKGGVSQPIYFTCDLNACFKFLEPELYRRGLRYQLNRLQDGHLAEIFKPSKGWGDCVAFAVDEKPATALCKAVEMLMEKQ